VVYYARIIAEKAHLRRLIRTATHIVSDGYEREDAVDCLLNEAEKKILEVSYQTNANAFQNINDVLVDAYDTIYLLPNHKGEVT
ncbi:replicative DNA helicase, partial [Bacillus thuringiensis]|nr:replicative DNA helicase [Bacillus thuringiensis]